MTEYESLLHGLEQAGLGGWRASIEPVLRERLSTKSHGDFDRWRSAVADLPEVADTKIELDTAAVAATSKSIAAEQREKIRDALMRLSPWRKGPFRLHGIALDAEWRCDLKWDRLAGAISPLGKKRVLDVGCGNGYYAYRMIGAGARLVIGIDPTLLYMMQFFALNHFLRVPTIQVLPLRLDEVPAPETGFDATFSMGVLYHQRNPAEHLAQLRAMLRAGGELVLDTLIFPGDEKLVYRPEGRYARMRNVWALPTRAALEDWLRDAGFDGIRLANVSETTMQEQRSTEWMPFESLREALDPQDPTHTIEGLPAPLRALLTCKSP